MDKVLGKQDFQNIEDQLLKLLEDDKRYWQVNDVKCDAVHTARTYEEFSERVAAAHLRPLEKADSIKKEGHKSVWNTCAKEEKKEQ